MKQLLGLELVKIILFTVPYVMAASATGFERAASTLLEKTDIIASTPHSLVELVDPFSSDEKSAPTIISLLQKQLQGEAERDWELACIPRPWKGVIQEGTLQRKHAFPELTIPSPVVNGPKDLFPEVYLSVYAAHQDLETVPPTSNVASSLLRDALVDTINILDINRIVAGRYLIDVDCYFAPGTFVKRATPLDRLRELSAGDRTAWKPEDVALDAVFSQLLQLPAPEHKLVYYHSLLTECCKIAPAAIAPSLGRAIRFLYCNLEPLDLELCYRYLDWFAHHLSNFGFTWKWSEWYVHSEAKIGKIANYFDRIDDLNLPQTHPKMAFITGVIDKEIRLSFAQRIKGTLPEAYQYLISEGKEKDVPEFKYFSDMTPYAKEGREIMQLIRRRASDEELQPYITAIENQAKDHGVADPVLPSADALVTSICFVGAKSLSHVLSCIERNKERLLSIGSPAARRQIITSVMEYWRDQPGIGVNIVDKLLNYTILMPLSVIEWALVSHIASGTILAEAHVYEMVSATVGKVTNRLRQIVVARTQPGLYEPQLSVLDDTLWREHTDTQALFRLIFEALSSIAEGNNDELMERGDGSGDLPEDAIIRQWGRKWLRVFKRKEAVEEAFLSEAMRDATPVGTEAPLPQPPASPPYPTDPDLDVADAE